MRRKIHIDHLLLVFVLLLPAFASAQDISKVATTGMQFLKMEPGSRAVGMGGAFVAVANDVSAAYWNPAGLATLSQNAAMFMHAAWLADINVNYVAIGLPVASHILGLQLTAVDYGEMEETTVSDPEGTGRTFRPTSFMGAVNYARMLTDRFSFGIGLKFVTDHLRNSSANSLALDVGSLYRLGNLSLAASVANFGTKVRLTGTDDDILIEASTIPGADQAVPGSRQTKEVDMPLQLRIGMAYRVRQIAPLGDLTLAGNLVHANDNNEFAAVGGEYVWNKRVALRAGYTGLGISDRENGLSFGGGLNFSAGANATIYLDYSFSDYGRLKDIQRFTVSVLF